MRPSLWLRFYAFITRGTLIVARTSDGEVFFTAAYESPFGGFVAHRHWDTGIGCFVCLEGGQVENSYVKEWRVVS